MHKGFSHAAAQRFISLSKPLRARRKAGAGMKKGRFPSPFPIFF